MTFEAPHGLLHDSAWSVPMFYFVVNPVYYMYQSQMVAIEALIGASAKEIEAIISSSFWLRSTQLGTAYLVFALA